MENKAHALIAGAFTLTLLVAGAVILWWFGGQRTVMVDYVVVTQQSVSGLNPQAAVRYRGIRVGRVDSIELDPTDSANILIQISVGEDVPITTETIAKMGYVGLTGLAYIQLDNEDQIGESTKLDRGRGRPRIPMKASMLQELSETGTATLRQAQLLFSNLNDILSPENKARIGKSLANLEASSANLNTTLADTRKLLSNPRLKQISAIVTNFEATSADSRTIMREASHLVPRLNALVDKADRLVGESGGEGLVDANTRLLELQREITHTARQLTNTLRMLEDAPHSVIFGSPQPIPGPGEPGFVAPSSSHSSTNP